MLHTPILSRQWKLITNSRVGKSLFGFSSKLLVFCERKSDLLFYRSCRSLKKCDGAKSDGSYMLFGIKRGKTDEKYDFFRRIALVFCKERFTHGHSFLKSDESDSLTVARFQRATRENRSQLLFKMSNFERMRERANYQPWPITTTFASPSMMQGRNWGQGTKTHIRRRWRREEAGRVYCRSSDQMYTIEWTQGLGEVGEPSWFMERG